jgi:hypothetical protein
MFAKNTKNPLLRDAKSRVPIQTCLSKGGVGHEFPPNFDVYLDEALGDVETT